MSSNVELGVQTEKAFQKQPLFLNSKAARKTTRPRRWYKDVGLGFKTPNAAVNGTYIGMLAACSPWDMPADSLQTRSAPGPVSFRSVAVSSAARSFRPR